MISIPCSILISVLVNKWRNKCGEIQLILQTVPEIFTMEELLWEIHSSLIWGSHRNRKVFVSPSSNSIFFFFFSCLALHKSSWRSHEACLKFPMSGFNLSNNINFHSYQRIESVSKKPQDLKSHHRSGVSIKYAYQDGWVHRVESTILSDWNMLLACLQTDVENSDWLGKGLVYLTDNWWQARNFH